ncbi:MAG: hypothetical protein FGM41_10685 [Bacteroidetes bacterium]|nr:hypothetical protein [Bacteroidota bacterium]
MKNTRTLIFFYLLTSLWASAQIKYEKRIEIEEKDGFENYQTFQFEESGIVVSYEKELKSGDLAEYYFDFYDQDLELKSTKKVAVSKKQSADFTCGTKKSGHALLTDKNNNYTLISLDVEEVVTKKVEGVFPKKLVLKEMVAMDDYVYIHGYIKKSQTLITINWRTGKMKLSPIEIPNVKPKKVTIQGFQVHEPSDEVFMFLKVHPDKKTTDVFMMRTDSKGQKKNMVNISDKTNAHIMSATASSIEVDNYIFMGTYADKAGIGSTGFYLSKSERQKMEYIKFYPFSSLKNFLDYLPKKQQAKLEKKISKKKEKGKTVDVIYNMVIHDLIKQSDGYVIIGECYYPTYRTETYYTTSTINGQSTQQRQTRQVFDGYKYTHAMVVKVDFLGELLWNKNFKMNVSEKPFRVIKFIKVTNQENEQVSMVFADDKKLVAKSIAKDGKVLREVEEEVIFTSNAGDKIKYTDSELKPWFENYFLAYGYQRIKNKEDKSVKKKRRVFYLNKVKYEAN